MNLNRDFYTRDTLTVAKDLLGKILVNKTKEGVTKGRIVDVEAYMGPNDKAAHSYHKVNSKRTQIQYLEGGYAYIYLIYGMYHCMNIVTSEVERPESVLIRGLEPVEGIELMHKRRGRDKIKELCNGPGKLCIAMGIKKEHYGMDLCGTKLYIEDDTEIIDYNIIASKRINIDYAEEAKDYLWRFTIENSPYISTKIVE